MARSGRSSWRCSKASSRVRSACWCRGCSVADDDFEVLLVGAPKRTVVQGLAQFAVHRLYDATDREAFLASLAPRIRGIAVTNTSDLVDATLMAKLPKLEIVSTFGVGYDHIDAN